VAAPDFTVQPAACFSKDEFATKKGLQAGPSFLPLQSSNYGQFRETGKFMLCATWRDTEKVATHPVLVTVMVWGVYAVMTGAAPEGLAAE